MRRLLFFIVLALSVAGTASAQLSVKAYVVDTLNNTPLRMATVMLVRANDSVIESFTRSGGDGHVDLAVRRAGKYIIKATYRGFADYVDVITIDKPVTDLGIIPMLSKEHLLKEVVITKQYAAIKIKGDTTEYVADSFKTKDNANVEDLLKKLPGMQVDKNGQITAQGETVAKILVDGEEFFSDDPKVVTKGLQAKAVDKVQVFDKKSDQAEFTGIDDGQKIKTINLELKEDYKKGYFGKVDAGGGTDGYFQNQAMINGFKGKRQLSAFGIASNTDKAGLGWDDNSKYSSGNGVTEITEDGDVMTTFTSSSEDFSGWDGKYNGQGLPKTWTGGAHYADKWNQDKDHLVGNYRYAMQNVELNGNTTTESPLSVQHSNKTQFSTGERHAADAMFEWKLDSTTTLKLTADVGLKSMKTSSVFNADAISTESGVGSNNIRNITSNSNGQFINADLLFRKKFAKKGRSLSIDIKENERENKSDGTLVSYLYPFVKDTINGTTYGPADTTNQLKNNSSSTLAFSAKATYTEPLSKTVFLEANYATVVNNSTSRNISINDGEVQIDPLYSSDYKFNVLTNRGGLSFKYNGKKVVVSAGSDLSYTNYLQQDHLHNDTTWHRSFFNVFPTAVFNYKISKQTGLNISYRGSTTQPTINQIQPLRDNTDPYNVTIGNPALKQEFDHNVNIRFNDYKVLTGRYTWASISFTAMQGDITTSQVIVGGRDTTQYVNVDGNYNGNAYMGGGFRLSKINTYIGGHLGASLYRNNNFINHVANLNNNTSLSVGLDLNNSKDNKYELSLEPSLSYNDNKATINSYSTSYYTFTTEFSGSVQLPKKFEIGSSVDVMIRQKTVVFNTNNNVVKWNAYIGKKFLKKGNLEARLSVFDILNQNVGFTRNVSGTTITQSSYNTIRRYGMLNLIWNFNHSPAAAAADDKAIETK